MKLNRLIPLALVVLILNLFWEFCHYKLYFDLTGIPSTLHLILASFVDVGLVFIIFLLVSLKNKKSDWIEHAKEKDYFFVILFGLILAFIWEFINLQLGRWTYRFAMPLFFNIGLSPLLQLAITGTFSLCIYSYLIKKC
ncbi:MAG: hypothetical protein ABFQ65_03355 [Nanoarchaeota archaeon]